MDDFIKENARARGIPIIRDASHELLKQIVQEYKPQNILEIGTAVGYSGISMLEAFPSAFLTTIELDEDRINEAKQNFKSANLEKRVELIHADCNEQISQMANNQKYYKYFDMVFLDGPKAQYIKLLENLLKLTKSGGIIVADNVLFRGFVRGDKSQMPRRLKTIVKRLEMFFDTVETNPQIQDFKLYNIEDGVLQIIVK